MTTFQIARPPGRDRRRPRGAGHRRAVPRPGRDHRGRPRRARRVRQGQDRLGQDARLRPADAADRPRRAKPGHPTALVLVPTRELAKQVVDVLSPIGKQIGVRVAAFYGGTSMDRQIRNLSRKIEVAVATPGRLIDLLERGELDLDADRDPHHRRGRPHGRHGIPAAGRVDHAQGPERPPDAACSPPRSTARSTCWCGATCTTRCCTRSCPTTQTSTRCCTAS